MILGQRACQQVMDFSKELFYVSPLTVKRGTVHPAIIETHIHEFTYCVSKYRTKCKTKFILCIYNVIYPKTLMKYKCFFAGYQKPAKLGKCYLPQVITMMVKVTGL